MKNTGVKKGITNEKIFTLLLGMDDRITNIDEQIIEVRQTMATKDGLETVRGYVLEEIRQEIRQELRPLHRAVDKDAKTIISHGKRIAELEKNAGIAA